MFGGFWGAGGDCCRIVGGVLDCFVYTVLKFVLKVLCDAQGGF